MNNRIHAGDSLEYGLNVADYPPADGWTLKQRLVPRFTSPAQAAVTLTATANGTVDGTAYDYVITATPATTAAWAAGAYGWHTWVEKVGARVTLEGTQYAGELTVLPDPATMAAGTDTRSQAQKGLDDAWAALAAAQAHAASASGGRAPIVLQIGERRTQYADAQQAIAAARQAINTWTVRVDYERARAEGRPTGPLGRQSYGVPQ